MLLRSDRINGTVKLPIMSTAQQDREQVWQEELPTLLYIENIKKKLLLDVWDVN